MRKDEIKLLLDKYIKKNYREEKKNSKINNKFFERDIENFEWRYYQKWADVISKIYDKKKSKIPNDKTKKQIKVQFKPSTGVSKSSKTYITTSRVSRAKSYSNNGGRKKKCVKKSSVRHVEYNAPYNFDDSKKIILEAPKAQFEKELSLDEYIKVVDESFIDTIFKIIDERKLKDVEVYKKANIDRKLFSKLRSGGHPSKNTAIALCIALKLNYEETTNLLNKAGYALSKSVLFDVIISFFIENKEYRIDVINKTLMDYDQKVLC